MEHNRGSVKKTDDAKILKERRRQQFLKTKHENKFIQMFYKRTRVEFDDVQNNVITISEVESLRKKIKRKSENIETELKILMRAFAIGKSHVSALLDEDDAFRAIVGYLTGNDSKLQIYAAYCITNITAHIEDCHQNVVTSCSPYLIMYLRCSSNILQDLCACALGNIASYSKANRDLLIIQGILKALIELFKADCQAVISSAAYAVIKMCEDEETTAVLLSMGIGELIMKHLSKKNLETSVIGDLAWLLVFLSTAEKNMKHLINLGATDIALMYIQHNSNSIKMNHYLVTPFIRFLGNALAVDGSILIQNFQCQTITTALQNYLLCPLTFIIKESLWVIANLSTINETVALLILQSDAFPLVMKYITYGNDICKEALICICNLASHGHITTSIILTSDNISKLISMMGQTNEEMIIILCLQLTDMLLRTNDHAVEIFFSQHGFSELKKLKCNQNDVIRNASCDLMTRYDNSCIALTTDMSQ